MGRFTFDDDDEQEPTFSLADFKKWLSKQGKPDPDLKNESVEEEAPRDGKEVFKDNLRKKRQSKKKKD